MSGKAASSAGRESGAKPPMKGFMHRFAAKGRIGGRCGFAANSPYALWQSLTKRRPSLYNPLNIKALHSKIVLPSVL
jgi:hypothetical protein